MESINEKIIRLRKSKGISQKKLAELVGVSQPTMTKIETGTLDIITITVGKKIAEKLDISFIELFDIPLAKENDGDILNLQKEIEDLKIEIDRLKSSLKDKETIADFNSSKIIALQINLASFLVEAYDKMNHQFDTIHFYVQGNEELKKITEDSRKILAKLFYSEKQKTITMGILNEYDFEEMWNLYDESGEGAMYKMDPLYPRSKNFRVRPGE